MHELGGQLLRLRLQLVVAGALNCRGGFQLLDLLVDPSVALCLGPKLRGAALLLIQCLRSRECYECDPVQVMHVHCQLLAFPRFGLPLNPVQRGTDAPGKEICKDRISFATAPALTRICRDCDLVQM